MSGGHTLQAVCLLVGIRFKLNNGNFTNYVYDTDGSVSVSGLSLLRGATHRAFQSTQVWKTTTTSLIWT